MWAQIQAWWGGISNRARTVVGILIACFIAGLFITHIPAILMFLLVTSLASMVAGAAYVYRHRATMGSVGWLATVFVTGWAGLGFWYLLATAGVFVPNIMLVAFITGIIGAGIAITYAGQKAKSKALQGFGIQGLALAFYLCAGYLIVKYFAWSGASGFPILLRIAWVTFAVAMVTIGIGLIGSAWGAAPSMKTWLACMTIVGMVAVFAVLESMNVTPFMDPLFKQPAVDAYEDIPALAMPQVRANMMRDLGITPGTPEARRFDDEWDTRYRVAYWYLVPRGVFSMRRGFSVLGESAIIHLDPQHNPRDQFFLWLADKAGLQPNMDPEDMKRRMAEASRQYFREGKLPQLQPSVTEQFFRDAARKVVDVTKQAADAVGGVTGTSSSGGVGKRTVDVGTPFREILLIHTPENPEYNRVRNIMIMIVVVIALLIGFSSIPDKGGLVFILGVLILCMATGVVQCAGREVTGSRSEVLQPLGQQPLIGAAIARMGGVVPIGRLNTGALTGTPFGPMAFTVAFPAEPGTQMSYWVQREGWRTKAWPDPNTPMNYAVYRKVWVVPQENGNIAHEIRLDWGAGTIVWAPVCVLDDVLLKYARNIDDGLAARAEDARAQCRMEGGGKPEMTEDDLRQAVTFQ